MGNLLQVVVPVLESKVLLYVTTLVKQRDAVQESEILGGKIVTLACRGVNGNEW